MQFTGLKDRNSVRIHAGDIVSRIRYDGTVETRIIEWPFCWIYSNLDEDTEVIGNIHENPELMEKSG